MKIKTYTASAMSEAMDKVRQELGESAIIISTQRLGAGAGVRVTAAIEETASDEDFPFNAPKHTEIQEAVRRALAYHGLPELLSERILSHIREAGKKDRLVAFATALDMVFDFHLLPERMKGQAFMITGPAGSGKTVTTAKLAARACMTGRKVGIIAADSVRAGATEQLAAFTSILDVTLLKARSSSNLRSHVQSLRRTCDLIFIDMPGLNPFQPDDMDYLASYAQASNALPVLTVPAGIDPVEASETAESFAEAGAVYLLATRLDAARRFGGVLAAAAGGRLTICEASMSPNVARGLCPINAVSLARLLLSSSEEESEPETRKKP